MHRSTRREFLQASAALLGASFIAPSFIPGKNEKLLSFSTLGCPDWGFQKIVDFAKANGYRGLEVRGIQRQLDLPKCNEFSNAQNIKATVQLMKEKELQFVGLGSSATLHFTEGAERQKNLEDARRFIDLAQQIGCPFVRVFPNKFPEGQDKKATMGLIAGGLLELGDYAKERNVSVLMETHGDVVRSEDLQKIMQAAEHSHVGLVWDVSNMWTVTQEPVAEAYQKLKKYIRHTHVKDAKLVNGKPQYRLLGQGDVPIFEAIDELDKGGYKGFYSFEWEKMWHPEIEEPEIALADFPRAMKKHFRNS